MEHREWAEDVLPIVHFVRLAVSCPIDAHITDNVQNIDQNIKYCRVDLSDDCFGANDKSKL